MFSFSRKSLGNEGRPTAKKCKKKCKKGEYTARAHNQNLDGPFFSFFSFIIRRASKLQHKEGSAAWAKNIKPSFVGSRGRQGRKMVPPSDRKEGKIESVVKDKKKGGGLCYATDCKSRMRGVKKREEDKGFLLSLRCSTFCALFHFPVFFLSRSPGHT